jgi:hypothetical protein
VWKKGDKDLIALFPTLPATHRPHECESYMHVGQHGAADCQGVIRDTRAAKPEEYAPLKRELEGIGYRLKVLKRVPRSMHEKRMRAVRERHT